MKNNPISTKKTSKSRKHLANIISKIEPIDSLETEQIKNTIEWILSNAELYRRIKPAIPNKHLATYFVLIDIEKNKILLVDHKLAKSWIPAGGHIEHNECPLTSVSREAEEELGINANFLTETPILLTVDAVGDNEYRHTDVTLWFALSFRENGMMTQDEREFSSIGWFDIDNLPANSQPHLPRFISKLRNRLAFQEKKIHA